MTDLCSDAVHIQWNPAIRPTRYYDHFILARKTAQCVIYIFYVIESATYGLLFTSCLCQKPERLRYERVRAFDTNNE